MARFYFLLLLFLFVAAGDAKASDNIVISEIAWMGSLPKEGETTSQASNREWIELYNPASFSVNLQEWKLISEDGTPDIILEGVISPNSSYLLERTSDESVPGIAASQIYVGALSNSGEYLKLKNKESQIIDEVNSSSGWLAGDNESKKTMQKLGGTWTTAQATPGFVNYAGNESGGTQKNKSDIPAPFSIDMPRYEIPTIKAYAGEDVTAAVGSLIEFRGVAVNKDNQFLEKVRLWWNFGDGDHKEGTLVTHIFQIPGKYIVGLHASSGVSASSDYLQVIVVPNKVQVSGVLLGKEGFITLRNPAGEVVDIGEWVLEDSDGKRFLLPNKTKIGAGSEISLSNKTTGLLSSQNVGKIVKVYYPNNTLAIQSSVVQMVPELERENGPENYLVSFENKLGKETDKMGQSKGEIGVSSTNDDKVSKNKGDIPAATESEKAAIGSSAVGFRYSPKLFFVSAALLSLLGSATFLFLKK